VTLAAAAGLAIEGRPVQRPREKKLSFSAASFGTRSVRLAASDAFIAVNGRGYRGRIELRKKKNGLLLVINELDVEEYLRGVIASEVPHDWEPEVLKAQAVASRSYALYKKKTMGDRPYHLLATVNGQVYAGKRGERDATTRAVLDTEGTVLTYQGEVIPAFYHASCGGHTEDAAELWGVDEPYLRGVDCDCQKIAKYGVWEKQVTRDALAAALAKQGFRLKFPRSIKLLGITAAGRVREVSIGHAGGTASVPAEKVRAALDLPSTFFEVVMAGGEIIFSGRGLGHGVGLCQWGAREMARRGFAYQAILAHYYPGTTLTKMKAP
jgi:stage II sporulation protein D